MPDNVIALAEGFRAQLIHGDAQAIQAMTRRWTAVEAALQAAIDDLTQEMAALKAKGEAMPQWKLWQMSKYQSLIAQIGAELAKYAQWAIVQIQDEQTKAQQLGDKHAKQMLLASLNGQRSLGTAWDKLPTEAVENITAIAQGDQPLGKLLANAYPTAVSGLTNLLITSTAMGRNPRETARLAVKKGLAQGLGHILLVARDQQIRNYREMVRQRYQGSRVVYGYMRLAARNTRTCLACLALDGTIYDTGEVMALHPQDRCAMVPLVEGFPLPAIQPASKWFESLSEDEQRRIMGHGRYEAWRDGLFDFRQLATVSNHPVWGPSARVTSLTNLLAGKGGLGGAPIDPAMLLKRHKQQKSQQPQKPQTLAVDKTDAAVLTQLMDDLTDAPLDNGTYQALKKTLGKILTGDEGLVYTDKDGRLTGALAYQPAKGNLNYLHITAAGFTNAEANKKAIVHAAELAHQQGQGLQLYVPQSHLALYQSWGFTVHQPLAGGARVRLRPDDIAGFLKDPDNYGQVKLEKLSQAAQSALADPDKAFTFRSGQAIPGLPFKTVHMSGSDFAQQTKALPYDPPLDVPVGKHAAAGMLLFTPDGKLVVVDPAGQYGGYQTTFPKGTMEDGMTLQETAVKEVFEETGFKAKVLGHLGDYEKSTSLTRFYIGVVAEGAPWAAHYETEAVRIVPLDQVDALLNVGTDKDIFQDLLLLQLQALEGKPFSPADLEAGLDKYAAAQGKLPPPPGSKTPAEMTKKELVTHLAKLRGIAQWKLNVATKDQVAALFDLLEAEALAAIESFGAAHTAKYAKQKGAETAAKLQGVVKLPTPAEDPTTLTKKALMQHLAQLRGIAQWKLSVMKKEDIVALFDLPEADALAAIEAAGQAHTDKYAGKKVEPKPLPPEDVAFQKYQQTGISGLSANEAQLALVHARQAGEAKAVQAELQAHYQAQIGDPLLLPELEGQSATKADLVTQIKDASGLPLYKLNTLKKAELQALIGQPVSQAHQALGLSYQPQTTVPPVNTPAAPTSPPPPKQEPSPPADPVDMQGWDSKDAANFFTELETAFEVGTPAYKGVGKAQGNISSGHSGFSYTDDNGFAAGVITFHELDSSTLKVSGAAFTDLAVNKEAMTDVANLALNQGKALKTYVPDGLKSTYKKWGFQESGAYMVLQPGDIPAFVASAGKKPKAAPKQAPQQTAVTAENNVIGTPGDASTQAAVKLSKSALVGHLAHKSGVPAGKLEKYTKQMLVQFMEMDALQAIDLLQKGSPPPAPTPPEKAPAAAPKASPQTQKQPLPENLPPFKLPDPPGFPADVTGLRTVKSLGGSTGAKLVQDPTTGKQYVLKQGNSADHLREEAYADAAYQTLGLNVPTFKVYETADGPVKLAEYKADLKTLGEALSQATPSERKQLVKAVQKGFAADALLGNWDVLGASKDNILVDGDGRIWRIDNGGSFRYRAQGKKKEAEFLSDYPVELWTMRDKKVGAENAQIFGGLDIYDIMDQVHNIVPQGEKLLAAVPEELRSMVHGRLQVMGDLLGTSDAFKEDKWQASYTDGFLEQSTYIRREGLIDALPQRMKQDKKGSVKVYDENGREFDVLRGRGSHVEAWADYCEAHGGDPGIIQYWMSDQAGSSWSDASKALKYAIAQARGNFDSYFWKGGTENSRESYEKTIKKVGKEKYHKTWAMWHAWVYESLRHMDFARKKGGVVELVRTEGHDTLKMYGIKLGMKGVSMKRGAAESASIFRAKKIVAGGEVTIQRVPLHRILGYYWTDRPRYINPHNEGGFLGNIENEFVFIPEGIPFDYVDSISGNKGVETYWE